MSEKKTRQKYSYDTKKEIVSEYFSGVPTAELVERYHIKNERNVHDWVRKVKKDGYEALYCKKRGRKPKEEGPKDEFEELKQENRTLQLEVNYLKKLLALRGR